MQVSRFIKQICAFQKWKQNYNNIHKSNTANINNYVIEIQTFTENSESKVNVACLRTLVQFQVICKLNCSQFIYSEML